MRLPLVLTLILLTATIPARAIPICEPPPIHAETCPSGSNAHFYPGLGIIANDAPDEVDPCTRIAQSGASSIDYAMVCESNEWAPMAQAICREQTDHSVICTGWPIGNDLVHLWSHSDTLLIDGDSSLKVSSVKLFCASIEAGDITLSVWNLKGRTTVTVSDFICSGVYDQGDQGPPGDEVIPCTDCNPTTPEGS